MQRLFFDSTTSKKYNLDKTWSYRIDNCNVGKRERWFESVFDDENTISVPSCWNTDYKLFGHEGILWYQTCFYTPASTIRVWFEGVLNECDVYIDDVLIGSHSGGFNEFSFTADGLCGGEHRITVRVDNTHTEDSTIPLSRVDWFHYGGIFRSVVIEELEGVSFDKLKVRYKLSENNSADAAFELELENHCECEMTDTLSIFLDDTEIYKKDVTVDKKLRLETGLIHIENIERWDTENPRLYTVRVEFSGKNMLDRIGFREIVTKSDGIYLNGRKLFLKGINRHEEHPDWGFGVPFAITKRDIDIIADMGCNIIRGSHYPVSKKTLDYLDEKGILFWEEIPMWGFPQNALANPRVIDVGLRMHREMIERDFNHPSIIIWGLHNEIDTRCDEGIALTEKFAALVREFDDGRLVTYATMYPLEDRCYKYADFVSVNMYIGWYEKSLNDWTEFLDKLKCKLKSEDTEKPIVMSEFGAAAIYGNNVFENVKWTEGYQAEYLEYTLNLFTNTEGIAGTIIWQFCDIRTSEEMSLTRARSFNNKGVLNEYRKPKNAFYTVRKIYKKFK